MKFKELNSKGDEEDPIVSEDSQTSSAKCVNGEEALEQLTAEIATLTAERDALQKRNWLLEEEVHMVRKSLCEQEIYLNNTRNAVIQYKLREHTDRLAELKMQLTSSTDTKKE